MLRGAMVRATTAGGYRRLGGLALVALACSCEGSGPTTTTAAASAAALTATSGAKTKAASELAPTAAPSVGLASGTLVPIAEFAHAAQVAIRGRQWGALLFRDGSDAAKGEPVRMVRGGLGMSSLTIQAPFTVHQVRAANLAEGRVAWVDGALPKQRLSVWDDGRQGPVVEGAFLGGAVGSTQAIVFTGSIDQRGTIDRPNGKRAVRLRAGAWQWLSLPGPAEAGWAKCYWDAAARPETDDFTLLQLCRAPGREFAYAVYALAADSDAPRRVAFDNAVFAAQGTARGTFQVSDDGTLCLGSDQLGSSVGSMTLARLLSGASSWSVTKQRLPTRLMSTLGVYGDRLLFTSGDGKLLESANGGETFSQVTLSEPAVLRGCSQVGCLLRTLREERWWLRAW
jgi:hypothetical protein